MREKKSGKIMPAPNLGARLTAGLQTLNLYIEVRILCPQPKRSERGVFYLIASIMYFFPL